MIRDFIKDLLKYLPAQIAPAIVGFVVIPIVTRLFLPEDYGNYVLVMATVSICITIVGWLSMSIIRFYPAYEKNNKLEDFYGTVIKLLFFSIGTLALIFLAVLFIFKSHLSNKLFYLLNIGILVFILSSNFSVLLHFLRARRQLEWYTALSIWKSVVTWGIGIALVVGFHFGVEGLLWGSVLSLAVVFPLLWRVAVKGSPLKTRGISTGLTIDMAKYSFPLVVSNLAAWILSLSDRYVLEFFRGSHEVGIYSASYAISEHSILLLTSLFLFATGPISMNIWEKEGIEKSREFVSKVTRYYLIVCIPAAVGLAVLAKPAISLLTAPEYHEGYRIVVFIALGGILLGLQQRFQAGPLFYKKTSLIMTATIISGLLNLGLNLIFIPRYGYMGAAATTLIGYAFLLAGMVIVSRKYFIWDFPFKTLAKVAGGSVIMAVVVCPVGNSLTSSNLVNLVSGIFVGVAVYFVMLLLLQEPKKDEIEGLQTIGKKILRRVIR